MVECFFSSITDEFPGVLRRSRSINIAFRAVCVIIFYAITIPMVTEVRRSTVVQLLSNEYPHAMHLQSFRMNLAISLHFVTPISLGDFKQTYHNLEYTVHFHLHLRITSQKVTTIASALVNLR